jgi:hypothetical protein
VGRVCGLRQVERTGMAALGEEVELRMGVL